MENPIMHATNLITETSSRLRFNCMAVLAALVLLVVGYSRLSLAQKSGPATFSSPGEASNALFQAVQNSDEETLERILGAGKEVTSSSDEIEDKLERERFSQKFQEMHRLVREPDGTTVLYIGAENWPFPIPLVSKNRAWYFYSEQSARMRQLQSKSVMYWQKQKSTPRPKQQAPTRSVNTPKTSSVATLRMLTPPLATQATSRLLSTGTTSEL